MRSSQARVGQLLAGTTAVFAMFSGGIAVGASSTTVQHHAACTSRTLIESAMPVELGPLVTHERVTNTVTVGGHHYYVGRLRGHRVVLTLTGIGPVNARHVTRQAFKRFSCSDGRGIHAVVFSGVAGGGQIGDVTVPTRWTLNNGRHFFRVNHRMLAAARRTARHHVHLERKTPIGDPACACLTNPDLVKTVRVLHKPTIEVGGVGQTTDPFSGHAFPCVPGGGDVFGCDICLSHADLAGETERLIAGALPLVDPKFISGYLAVSSSESARYVAEDEETAAVNAVATHHHVAFLGFRAVSDGGGDPLHLPGFPTEFFVYRQLAADNAARATLAFLSHWSGRVGRS